MHALELIRRKHAGHELTAEDIQWLVRGAVAEEIPDYQLSALLMAICYEHLSFNETVAFTRAFVESGETLAWPEELGTFIDKHSTGGVGDKVSLVLLPILACLGFKVAKMSGRSLGHTGGTIDKLESTPGFNTKLTREQMLRVVRDVGCCIVEQTADLVPADKLFYALRDATDTVSELGLIAASVMSKKIACGAPLVLLDVKCGSGAFFRTGEEAGAFALLAIQLGREFNRKVSCVVSRMDQPLGMAVGNAIEVLEALRFLDPGQWRDGEPPSGLADLAQLVEALLTTACDSAGIPEPNVMSPVTSGAALEKFKHWIAAQSGDLDALIAQYSPQYRNAGQQLLTSEQGYVHEIYPAVIGEVLSRLGAGRRERSGKVDHGVGLLCHVKLGQKVATGEKLATLFGGAAQPEERYLALLSTAFLLGDGPIEDTSVVLDKIS